jgi:probable phosphoglycerate mutase
MVYFFRHGETEWNRAHRYQGAKNSPLTDYGRSQIELVCSLFEKEPDLPNPLMVYVSPLGRAIDTANILEKYINATIIIEDRLREVSLGSWDGMTHDEIRMKYPHAFDAAMPYNWYFQSPDGESLVSAKERVSSWLREVNNQTVCAISHGLIGRILMGVYVGLSDDESLKLAIAQDAYYKMHNSKFYPIGKNVLNPNEV